MKEGQSPPGTGLTEKQFKEQVLLTRWHPNAKYAWDTGIAIGRYLQELRNGRIIGTQCHRCWRVVVPPRVFCEQCFKPMSSWEYLKDTGTVNTFSICYITWDAQKVDKPSLPAVIEIDGASPGMGILHLLGEVEPEKVRIGMKVQAVWKLPRERRGSVTDIRYFKPI